MRKIIILACLLGIISFSTQAQNDRNNTINKALEKGWTIEVKAGLSSGGFSPIPLPREIRSIRSYSPGFNALLECQITKWIGSKAKWGISSGLIIENKGMETKARVKSYHTEIINRKDKVSGFWTGNVKTNIDATYITIPLKANYKLTDRFKISFGPYFSYLLDGTFDGEVSNGYLRVKNPTGQKLSFENGKSAKYDFSNDMREFMYGALLGCSWQSFKHLSVFSQLSWGYQSIFPNDFKTISFKMYPIYLAFGLSYNF